MTHGCALQRNADANYYSGLGSAKKQIDHLAYMKGSWFSRGCGLLKQLPISVSRRWIAPIRSCFNKNAKWSIYFFADP